MQTACLLLQHCETQLMWVMSNTSHVIVLAGSSYAPSGKGASVRSNKTSVGWAKKAAGAREEAQSPKVIYCIRTEHSTCMVEPVA